jgi:hypothetical protein
MVHPAACPPGAVGRLGRLNTYVWYQTACEMHLVKVIDAVTPKLGESGSVLGEALRELLSRGYELRAVKRLDGIYEIVATGTLGSAITGEDGDFYTALTAMFEQAGL